MRADSVVSALTAAFALLTLYAVDRQLVIHVQLGFSVVNFFSYFTNLSNIFAAFVLLLNSGMRQWPPARFTEVLRLMAVTNMTAVGIVFAVLLRDADLGSLLPWVNFMLHYLMPCVVIVDWILLPPRMRLAATALLLCLIFPTFYLTYLLIRGSIVGWYPYNFLNPTTAGGYGGVTIYTVGVATIFLLGDWILLAIGNRRVR